MSAYARVSAWARRSASVQGNALDGAVATSGAAWCPASWAMRCVPRRVATGRVKSGALGRCGNGSPKPERRMVSPSVLQLASSQSKRRMATSSVLQLAGSQSTNTMVSRACPTAVGGHLAYSLAFRRMVSPSVSQLAGSQSKNTPAADRRPACGTRAQTQGRASVCSGSSAGARPG